MSTIVALATPPGRSGIAVIRLSGDSVLAISQRLINDNGFQFKPRHATLKKIFDPVTKDVIDDVILTYFKAPQSFTGEDVVEISCHGSPILIRQILDLCLSFEARLAQPGEFSLRALANGRMNLSQAEAIRDLIESQTVAAARQSIRQMHGELSNQLQPLKDELLEAIVVLESALEFVEDDLPEYQIESIKDKLNGVVSGLEKMAGTFRAGKLLREGLKIAFAGRPNVGKSSLFNALLGNERAIVTDIPGTTRDSLHENLSIHGIPVSLIDTAGLRQTQDTVETLGVERTRRTLADSDLVVVVLDGSQSLTFEDFQVLNEVKKLNHVIAINKVDLGQTRIDFNELHNGAEIVAISALRGTGLDDLQRAFIAPFTKHDTADKSFLITDARHADLINRAKQEVVNSLALIDKNVSEEIILIGLHNSLRLLGHITGETSTEDLLTRVFSTFCVGK